MSAQTEVKIGFMNALQVEVHIAANGILTRRFNYARGEEELLMHRTLEEFLEFFDEASKMAREGWSEVISRRMASYEQQKKDYQEASTLAQPVSPSVEGKPAITPVTESTIPPRRRS